MLELSQVKTKIFNIVRTIIISKVFQTIFSRITRITKHIASIHISMLTTSLAKYEWISFYGVNWDVGVQIINLGQPKEKIKSYWN